MRKKRRHLKTLIKKRIRELQQQRIDQITHILETQKGNKRAFEAQRLLRKSDRKQFKLKDKDGHLSNNPHHVLPLLTEFYTAFFN